MTDAQYSNARCTLSSGVIGANVLVNEQAMSKLADFGCSKQIPQLLTMSLEESLRSIRGSIPWMAPEVVKQERHGYKADVWSIGATVVEMATAKHPWPTCTDGFSAMYAIATATDPPPPPTHLSPEAKAFLQRCFCINPDGEFRRWSWHREIRKLMSMRVGPAAERATAQELLQHPFLAER
jgi:serine/threonine protein kinase